MDLTFDLLDLDSSLKVILVPVITRISKSECFQLFVSYLRSAAVEADVEKSLQKEKSKKNNMNVFTRSKNVILAL